MWVWDQSRGCLFKNGELISKGYAGKGRGKNNPALQNQIGVGPIPRGLWQMTAVKNSPNTGPYTIVLEPMAGTDTLGRSAFRVHGDSVRNPGTASRGCIVLPRNIRERMFSGKDKTIKVVE